MKALELQAPERVAVVEREIPSPEPGWLLVRTGAATICTSDLNDIHHNPFGTCLPAVIGHEASGTVVAVGDGVQAFKPGQRVATHPVHPCYQCPECQRGLTHLCREKGHFGVNLPGTFSEYYLVRQDRARLIPQNLDFAVAALAEPLAVCLEALEQANLAPGKSLLILGDGPFGVIMARLAARLPLERLVIAGLLDFRLSSAPAERVNLSSAGDPCQAMLAANRGEGYHAAILAVGSPRALADGLRCLLPRGRMVVFSAIHGEPSLDLFSLHLNELEMVGACSDQDFFDQAVNALHDPAFALGELVTHRFRLLDYRQALAQAEFGRSHALKVAFEF
jgi:threonine dehydrogenase-like Zn-dependent dehydrogenase